MDGRGGAYSTRESTLAKDTDGNFVLHTKLARHSDHGTQRAACCLFGCNVLLGPLLLIGGIVLLSYPNDRSSLISQYNGGGNQYNSTDVFQWSGGAGGGSINGQATSTRFQQIQPAGDTSDIDIFSSYFASVYVPFASIPVNPQIANIFRFELNGVVPFTRVVIPTRIQTQPIFCEDKHGCVAADMTSACVAQYGSSALYDGNGCLFDGGCGVCRISSYLQNYCAVVTPIVPLPPEDALFAESDHYRSCNFPFTSADQLQTYGPTKPTSIEFQVLRKGDPYILMQSLTSGTMNFGSSPVELRKSGTILTSIGAVFMVLAVVTGYCLYRSAKESSRADDIYLGGAKNGYGNIHGEMIMDHDVYSARRSMLQKGACRPSVLQQLEIQV